MNVSINHTESPQMKAIQILKQKLLYIIKTISGIFGSQLNELLKQAKRFGINP